MQRFSSGIVLTLLLLLGGCASGPMIELSEPDQDGIPIELYRDGLIYFRGVVNGTSTDIILDSGAAFSIISEKFAAQLGLGGGEEFLVPGTVGTVRAKWIADGVELAAANLTIDKLPVAVIDLTTAESLIAREMPVILGREVFNIGIVDIDYPNRRLYFRDPKTYRYDGGGVSLQLLSADSCALCVVASVEGFPATHFDVDTGSASTLTIYQAYERQTDLLSQRTKVSSATIGGVSGWTEVKRGTVSSIDLGQYRLSNLPVTFYDGQEGIFAHSKASGNLGNMVFNRFRVVFDVPGQAMHLEPSLHWNRPFDKDRSGLGTVHRGDYLEVTNIAVGSPADQAGWQAGDRIVAIDGVAIANRHPNKLWSQRAAGTVIVLTKNDGKDYRLELNEYY